MGTSSRYDQQLTLKGVFHLKPRHVEQALKLIIAGDVDPNLLISHEMPLKDITKALEMMSKGETMKVSISP